MAEGGGRHLYVPGTSVAEQTGPGMALTIAGSALMAAGAGILIWNATSHDPEASDKEQRHDACLEGLSNGSATDEECQWGRLG